MNRKLIICVWALSIVVFGSGKIFATVCQDPEAEMTIGGALYNAANDKYYICEGKTITFDASASYDPDEDEEEECADTTDNWIRKFDWVFGDGESYSEDASNHTDGVFDGVTTHPYLAAGECTVSLIVHDNDDDCCCSSGCQDATSEEAWYETVVIAKMTLKSIEFTSDHEDGSGDNVLKRSPDNKFGTVGSNYEEPEWEATGRNHPITHTKDTEITVKVTVLVEPSGVPYKLVGVGSNAYVGFESVRTTSTGADQEITITSDGKLPNKIRYLDDDEIQWKMVLSVDDDNEQECDVVDTSGPHKICVTWDTPDETTEVPYTTSLTFERIKLLCKDYSTTAGNKGICGGNTTIDECGEDCQDWIATPSFTVGLPVVTGGDPVWGLLDGVGKGMCAQGGLLMNMMTELLGIDSLYEHIKAAAWLPVPITYRSPVAPFQIRPKTTTPTYPGCTTHHPPYPEALYMWLGDWNDGEGGCKVGDTFYAALMDINGVASSSPAYTAEHHALYQIMAVTGNSQKWRLPSNSPHAGAACGETAPVPPLN